MVRGTPALLITCRYPNMPIIKKVVVWICNRHTLSDFEPQRQISVRRAGIITLIKFMDSIMVSGTNHGHHSKVEFHSLSS